MKALWLFLSVFLLSIVASAGGKYGYLDKYDTVPENWHFETTESIPPAFQYQQKESHSLSDFYKDFKEDGVVSIYLGHGKDAYSTQRAQQVYQMLRSIAQNTGATLNKWFFNGQTKIAFQDWKKKVRYEITLGNERNAFQDAFSEYEVVMYHGHSRYGRGPAFGTYSNYYRMGNKWREIEVDTRNAYFQMEEILNQEEFPIKTVNFSGKSYEYQYRGQKVESSKLPNNAYTKVIPGGDVDLVETEFKEGRQLFWFYSCKNVYYWRKTLRNIHPDMNEKFIFGTKEDSYWSAKPASVMIMSIVQGVEESQTIISELNATNDCNQCFTSY